jgi:hypothetical protein
MPPGKKEIKKLWHELADDLYQEKNKVVAKKIPGY